MNEVTVQARMRGRRLLEVLNELVEILEKEGEENSIRGVKAARGLLAEGLDRGNVDQALDEVASIFKTLYQPHAPFPEFFIWRDDFDERFAANKKLDQLKLELNELLQGS